MKEWRRRARLAGMLALLLTMTGGCGRARLPRTGGEGERTVAVRPIEEVLAAHTPDLMRLPGVVGTGAGERQGRPVIVVLVESATPEIRARLPRALEGYPVEVREAGIVRPLQDR